MATSRPGLGYPAISNPRDARAVADSISNIRQRIEAIEGMLTEVNSTVIQSSSTGSTQFNVLRQLIAQLTELVNQLEGEILAADDAQIQLATRVFVPHAPPPPAPPPEEQMNQIAVRAFMPHVPLTQDREAADVGAQLAARAFMPHVPLKQESDTADSARIIAAQVFGA